MFSSRPFLRLLALGLALLATGGCGGEPPPDHGAPGVTPPDVPQTSEEAIEQSRKAAEAELRTGSGPPKSD